MNSAPVHLFLATKACILAVMAHPTSKPNGRARPAKSGGIYRGVRLQRPFAPSQFSDEEIRRAVEAAIKENADIFAGGS
jgi:hypothetical protein